MQLEGIASLLSLVTWEKRPTPASLHPPVRELQRARRSPLRLLFSRPLRAPSSLALSTAREGAATASLGSQGQGLTTLRVKNFFLRSDLNLPSFSLKPSPLVPSLYALVTAALQLSRSPSGHWQLL